MVVDVPGWLDRDRLRSHVVDANDGVIATAGVVEGFIVAGARSVVTLAAGLAATLAGAIALGAAKYAEASGDWEAESALVEAEAHRLALSPGEELDELAGIYESKGLSPALARAVAEELSTRDALAAQLDAEYGIAQRTSPAMPVQVAVGATAAFVAGAALPLLIFVLFPVQERGITTIVAVLVALSVISWLAARLGGTNVRRTLVRNVVIGLVAMLLAVLAGLLLPI
jgi:VIT1/CCC1 family predicted Fe2+/Mn2+ transporter